MCYRDEPEAFAPCIMPRLTDDASWYAVFLAQSLYARRLYAECLALCKELLAIDGFDERDVTDMALRCCKRLGDGDSGEELARHCRSKVCLLLRSRLSGLLALCIGLTK